MAIPVADKQIMILAVYLDTPAPGFRQYQPYFGLLFIFKSIDYLLGPGNQKRRKPLPPGNRGQKIQGIGPEPVVAVNRVFSAPCQYCINVIIFPLHKIITSICSLYGVP